MNEIRNSNYGMYKSLFSISPRTSFRQSYVQKSAHVEILNRL